MLFFYGSRHYGKSNLSSRYGVCTACGVPDHLSSYDTARFLHLYWIPLIPAGHTRIIDHCPNCDKCISTTPGKFKKEKAGSVETVMTKIQESPNDPDMVIKGINTLVAYNEEEMFDKFAKLYTENMANNADVLLAIANGQFRLGRFSQCIETCKKARLAGAEKVEELLDNAQTYEEIRVKDDGKPPRKFGIPILTPYLVPLLIIFGILGQQGLKGFNAGKAREVWLLNGSQMPYSIQLDGKTYSLQPNRPTRIHIPMGEHTVTIQGTLFPMEAFSFNYKLPIWQRIDDDATLVLNPDRLACLINESIPYVMDGCDLNPESEYEYYFGKNWHVIPDIDYAFRELPRNIDMYEEVEYKNHLTQYEADSYMDALNILSMSGSHDDLIAFAKQAMQFDAANGEGSVLLSLAGETGHRLSTPNLKQRLATRPLLIEWHRFYQTAMENEQPDYDLEAAYRDLVENEPEVPELKYLLGRVMKDSGAALEVLWASEEGTGSNGYGYNAVAYNLLVQGKYAAAANPAELANRKNPGQTTFEKIRTECRLANLNYEPILQEIRNSRKDNPTNGDLTSLEIRYLCLQKKRQEAIRVGAAYIKDNESWMEPASQQEWKDYFQATQFYAEKNISAYLTALTNVLPDAAAYEKALHSGDIKAAFQTLEKDESADFSAYLIVYCAAEHHNDTETAKRALEKVIEWTNEPDLVGILNGSEPMTPEKMTTYEMYPDDKKLVACALGFQHPEDRSDYFRLAKTCNYSPFYPQLLLNTWISKN